MVRVLCCRNFRDLVSLSCWGTQFANNDFPLVQLWRACMMAIGIFTGMVRINRTVFGTCTHR